MYTLEKVEATAQDYFKDLTQAIHSIDYCQLKNVLAVVLGALSKGQTVYIAGNGGSAASAIHMAADIGNELLRKDFDQRPRVQSLVDNPSRITALANDFGYQEIFAMQLEHARRGDVLLLMSVSGNSANLIKAALVAKTKAVDVVSLVARESKLTELSEAYVVLGNADYGLSEDLQSSFFHLLKRLINHSQAHLLPPTHGDRVRDIDTSGSEW